jgi:hypothetical protein
MTATGRTPDGEPDLPVTPEDHAYFRALEEAFLRLRDKATLLAAADWQVAQGWHRAGIPIEVVVPVMETLFARARERRKRTISSLAYFKAAVEAAWEEVQSLTAGGRKERLEPVRVEERLRRLADRIGPGVPGGERIRGAIVALSGELDDVERSLAALDAELLAALQAGAGKRESAEDRAAIDAALAGVAARLPKEELARAREHLFAQRLRQRHALPVLSLFAPEARQNETPAELESRTGEPGSAS